MAWIRVIEPSSALEPLKGIYDRIAGARGKIANIMAVHSLRPRAMERHLDLYRSLLFGRSGLSREEKEMIAVVVSAANGCEYCVRHHAEALFHYRKDRTWIEALIREYSQVDLSDRVHRILDYSIRLTRTPRSLGSADIDGLREAGLSDSDVLEINMVASYFNFVNRIALGLGVEFTPDEVEGYDY